MGLDGIFLRAVALELKAIENFKVQKIIQPSSYEVVVNFRGFGENKNLLISASSSAPKIHFTNNSFSGCDKVFPFGIILKSRLKSAKLVKVYQEGLDRILYLEFSSVDEIGQPQNFVLSVELFSRYSNVILYNKDSLKIEDSVKRVNIDSFTARPVLPKLNFIKLLPQEKLDISEEDGLYIFKNIFEFGEKSMKEALLSCLQGMSKFVANVLGSRFEGQPVGSLNEDARAFVFDIILRLKSMLKHGSFDFVAVLDGGRLKDFTFFDVSKFCNSFEVKRFDSASELLDFFYEERAFIERQSKREDSVVKYLKKEIAKATAKLKAREEDLAEAEKRKLYKNYGDLLSANMYRVKKGQQHIELEDFYNNCEPLCLELNPKYDVSWNVQHYYRQYKKSKVAIEKLEILISQVKKDLNFLKSELGFVLRCKNEEDLNEIVAELNYEGFGFKFKKRRVCVSKKSALEDYNFLKFKSTDGFYFYCGRNNKQNDVLTLKKAKKNDMWLHVSDMTGSHVVIFSNGKELPKSSLYQAALAAAYYSEARESRNVSVWYTLIKNISKPKGMRTGMVTFKNCSTITVTQDIDFLKSLQVSC